MKKRDETIEAWKKLTIRERQDLDDEVRAKQLELAETARSMLAAFESLNADEEQRATLKELIDLWSVRSLRHYRDTRADERREHLRAKAAGEDAPPPAVPTTKRRPRIKNLERFNYWRMPEINRWLRATLPEEALSAAHESLEAMYAHRHAHGDANAMFDYARENARCFRSAWFVDVVESWRDEGRDEDLRRLMKQFARNVSTTATDALQATILRDQAVFARIARDAKPRGMGQLFGDLANEVDLSEDSIKLVYEAYNPYWKSESAHGISMDEFFRRLKEMATLAF
jgi:hypothetical protein